MRLTILPYLLRFRQLAETSWGVYTVRKVWYLLLSSDEHPERRGIGECAPLPDLSSDLTDDYESVLTESCRWTEKNGCIDMEALRAYPSILFSLETAFRQYEKHSFSLWDTPFSQGRQGIPINGLIWMGEYREMLSQIEKKLEQGFRCIKLKIGALDFEQELHLLRHIHSHFSAAEVELRVDANGAFSPADAMWKLEQLATLDLHSIEQPIRAGQWEEMARLTAKSPLPIALDEELIGWNQPTEKTRLLTCIRPQYIILKPSLHGGISGGEEWIREAEKQQIGWWITSALESNIGLHAIAQWCASFSHPLPQGLGTGGLFTNNIEMPLSIQKDCLWYDPDGNFPSFSFFREWKKRC
ncbi:MAG: o-succinylbenzoate synthase [Tannerellaceae bacterium]|nr:o-succinylbenzoate synthase [Tannerellaceae bacterium]